MANIYTNVQKWYLLKYPYDKYGYEIDEKIIFQDVFNALKYHKDIYELLGVDNSIMREHIFSELATIIDVDYNYIYTQWTGKSL